MTEPTPVSSEYPPEAKPQALCTLDFHLLARPFLHAIACLFPPGMQLDFLPLGIEPPPETNGEVSLLVPLPLDGLEGVALRLRTGDREMAHQVQDEWLLDRAALVAHILPHVRQAFVDSESGLYNLRALPHALAVSKGAFFLIESRSARKQLADALQHQADTANLLAHAPEGAAFFCGNGLYAVLRLATGDEDTACLEMARRVACVLQRRFRQAGLDMAHILYMDMARGREIFTESGLAGFQEYLVVAGKQGPFGLVSAADRPARRCERFRLADNGVFRSVQHKWQGQSQFAMAIFRVENLPEGPSYEWVSQVEVTSKGPALWLDDPHTLVCFFAGAMPEETAPRAEKIRDAIREIFPDAVITIGIAGFPCLDYAKKHTPANCFKALRHAQLLGPGNLVIFDQLTLNVSGDSFFEEGDYPEAMREYRRGLRLKPDDVNLLNSLGVTFAAHGQNSLAADCFRRALTLDEHNHMALANLGYILLRSGKTVEALAILEQALSAFPQDEDPPAELFKSLVQLHLEQKRHSKARATLTEWAKRRDIGKDAIYHRQLGLTLKNEGLKSEAMRALEQALKLAPNDAIALAHLGELYRLTGEGKELGLHFCQQAVRLKRDDATLWRILGESLLACNSLDAAERAVEQCLRLDKTDGEAMWLAARINRKKKNIPETRYWLNRARKLHTISASLGQRLTRALATLPGKTQKNGKTTQSSGAGTPKKSVQTER